VTVTLTCSGTAIQRSSVACHKAAVFVYNTLMTKTVLSLTQKEIESYRRSASLLKPKRDEKIEARHTRAWQAARKAARLLKKDFGVKKVMAFGSLTHPALFHERSDVDLAVWGLTGREYYRAASILLDIDPSISMDLIAFEEARPRLQEVILKEGRSL